MLLIIFFMVISLFYILLLEQHEKRQITLWLKERSISARKLKKLYQELFFSLTRPQVSLETSILKFQKLPTFSFYKEIISTYLQLTSSMGIAPGLWAQSLRASFISHFQFNNKFKKKVMEIIFQMFMIYGLSYVLVFSISIMIPEVSINLLPIFCWQVFGGISFFFIYKHLYQKKFRGFKECLYSLISFNTLLRIGISQQKIIEISRMNELKADSSFKDVNDWLLTIVLEWSQKGGKVLSELELLQDEAWWQFEQRMEDFNQVLAGLRLFILFVFGLPSYFFIILQFNQNLL